jgi:hypothetical protein
MLHYINPALKNTNHFIIAALRRLVPQHAFVPLTLEKMSVNHFIVYAIIKLSVNHRFIPAARTSTRLHYAYIEKDLDLFAICLADGGIGHFGHNLLHFSIMV